MSARNPHITIDLSDPQFTEDELRRAAAGSAGSALQTLLRLYEVRGLSMQSWIQAPANVKATVRSQAQAAAAAYHAYVLVSLDGNVSRRTYLGRDAAEEAASFSAGSCVVDLYGSHLASANTAALYFLGLFPDNEPLVDALLRRWGRLISYVTNTPASRAAAIARGRKSLAEQARIRAEVAAAPAPRQLRLTVAT